MTHKEKIFAQNWIEQFRAGRELVNSGRFSRHTLNEWHPGPLIWSYTPFASGVINGAFPWEETRETDRVWGRRYTNIDYNIFIR